jgi:hypothetical protein
VNRAERHGEPMSRGRSSDPAHARVMPDLIVAIGLIAGAAIIDAVAVIAGIEVLRELGWWGREVVTPRP